MRSKIVSAVVLTICALAPLHAQTGGLLQNGGFEQGDQSWSKQGDVVIGLSQSAHGGRNVASFGTKLNGQPALTGAIRQTFTIPANIRMYGLTFWLAISTREKSTAVADKLVVEVLDSADNVLEVKATFSNLDITNGYKPYKYPLAYAGRAVKVRFRLEATVMLPTTFLLDDVAVDALPSTSFSGVITDVFTSQGIRGAQVSWAAYTFTTDANGRYSFTNVLCDTALLTVTAPRYFPSTTPAFTPRCGTPPTVKDLTLKPFPTSVSGTIKDGSTGAPVAGAGVTWGTVQTSTTNNGTYLLSSDRCLMADLTVQVPFFKPFVAPNLRGDCGASLTRDFVLTPELTHVNVGVVDALTRKVLSTASVTFAGRSPMIVMDDRHRFPGVPCAAGSLRASAPGYRTTAITYTPTCDVNNYVELKLQPHLVAVTGKVTITATTVAIAGATVDIGGVRAVTSTDGSFAIPDIPCRADTIRVSAVGFQPLQVSWTPACDGSNQKNLALTPVPAGTSVCGIITDVTFKTPVPNTRLKFGSGTNTVSARSGVTGSYCLTNPPCLSGTLTVEADQYATVSTVGFAPVCGKSSERNIEMRHYQTFGQVVDMDTPEPRAPIVGATVTWGKLSTVTGTDGFYRFYDVCQTGDIVVNKPGYVSQGRTGGMSNCTFAGRNDVQNFGLKASGTNIIVVAPLGATVTWGTHLAVPGNTGRHSFTNVPCQTASLSVSAERFHVARQSFTPICNRTNYVLVNLAPK